MSSTPFRSYSEVKGRGGGRRGEEKRRSQFLQRGKKKGGRSLVFSNFAAIALGEGGGKEGGGDTKAVFDSGQQGGKRKKGKENLLVIFPLHLWKERGGGRKRGDFPFKTAEGRGKKVGGTMSIILNLPDMS